MRAAIALAFFGLVACSSAAEDAEKEYDIVRKNPTATPLEECRAARKVSDAYLAEHDAEQYERWHGLAESYCALAD